MKKCDFNFFNAVLDDMEKDFHLPTKKVIRVGFNDENITAHFDINEDEAYALITKLASQLDKAKVLKAVAKAM